MEPSHIASAGLLTDPQTWISLLTLTALEIVLGIDNIVFISILAAKLPKDQQAKARQMGLAAALISRLALLGSLAFIVKLTKPIFTVLGNEISGRDLVLLVGGLFLIWKSTKEIHAKVEGDGEAHGAGGKVVSFSGVIVQIMFLDLIFSLDSVITAVGMVDALWIMVVAVILAVIIMLMASGAISQFVNEHPTVKMLALSFLLLVGTALVAEGFDIHIPKGYIYFAMAFSLTVEMLNIRMKKKTVAKP
jgi:predicted tellurium resistance membrane protein TerC